MHWKDEGLFRTFVDPFHISNNIFPSYLLLGRGDRMKQAKADAQELIDQYRAEKQQEFNNSVLAAGKFHVF